jgi:uncharacterized lipoprotein
MGNRKGPRQVLSLVGILSIVALALSGCVAAALTGVAAGAGVGTAAYVNGEHLQVHRASLDRTWNATLAALKQMNMRVETDTKDAAGGTITAKRADGTDIKITEEPADKNTRVKIRVGTFGDQKVSESIQQRIASNLG